MFIKLKNTSDLPDEKLLERFKKTGDTNLIAELFERYTHLVFGVSLNYLKDEEKSKDAVMQIFEELFSKLKTHDVQYFKSWLYTTTKNYCLMQLRKEKQVQSFLQKISEKNRSEFMENLNDDHHNSEELHISDEKLHAAINGLKKEQKECIELFYLQNKSYKEVTEITGYDLKEVKSYIQNGKRMLKNVIKSSQ